jgi:hypothetical protein
MNCIDCTQEDYLRYVILRRDSGFTSLDSNIRDALDKKIRANTQCDLQYRFNLEKTKALIKFCWDKEITQTIINSKLINWNLDEALVFTAKEAREYIANEILEWETPEE